ncbi:MAG: glycosyltransferase family 2 protein [Elusimicrobia bacterium]|nr:glycosyltransferase family 2 protein [Elusimicrobiota bacterium]
MNQKPLSENSISVILPAYNEAGSIEEEIVQIQKVLKESKIPYEFIVVDDGSTDETSKIAQNKGVKVVRHLKNRGVGAARKTGILSAQNEIILTTDADGTYPQQPMPNLLQLLINNNFDMVVGARVKEKGTHYWLRLPAKFLIRKLASYLCKEKIPDLNSGLRVFKKSVALKYFYLLPDSHSWESTITLAFLCNHQRVYFYPIDYFRRSGGKSSFHPIKDTYNYFSLVIRTVMYFNPLRIFLPLFVFVLLSGCTKTIYDWLIYQNIGGFDVMLILSSLIILLTGLLADLMVVLHRKLDHP